MARLSLRIAAASLPIAAALVLAAPIQAAKHASQPGPIVLQHLGSFTTTGTVASEADGGTIHCDHGYVDFAIPPHPRKMALFLWHSSSVQVWQQRWDGGEGYQQIFLRRGYPVYMWDGPRVGRGSMACEGYQYVPRPGSDQRNWTAWRFGPKAGQWFPNVSFPKNDSQAMLRAMNARYDEFDFPKNAHLEADAAAEAIDRIGPSVLVTNSAGGWRAMLAALKSDNVRAIVAYETPGFVFPDGEGPQEPESTFGPTHVPLAQFMRLTRFPIQLVFGDNIPGTRWDETMKVAREFVASVNRHGGHAEIFMLPSAGLKGNTHIAFADLNNVAVADQLSLFLHKHGLDLR